MNHTIAHRELIRTVVNFAFAPANVAITNSVVAFKASMTTLKTKLGNVDNLYQQRSQIITGFSQQKKNARLALAGTSYSIMSATRAYAISVNNQALANDMKVSLSNLKTMSYPGWS
jgi:hypothetical protein